jgi:acetyl-CoA carboxylase biotin carboxyl carrier protein
VNDSRDAIHRIIEAFERSDWSEIDIRSGDVHVHLAAHRHETAPAPTTGGAGPHPTAPAAQQTDAGASSPLHPDAAFDVPLDAALDGAHVVVSPSPGIFWCSPAPGQPPFAAIGDLVEPSTTLCIVEVMKLMSHLKAGVAGEVVAVYGRNGERIQKGEALFAIAPTGSAS